MVKEFKRTRMYEKFKDNIWAADLAEMRSLSSKNWGVKCLLCMIDVFMKYTCVKPWEDKNLKQFLMVLLK